MSELKSKKKNILQSKNITKQKINASPLTSRSMKEGDEKDLTPISKENLIFLIQAYIIKKIFYNDKNNYAVLEYPPLKIEMRDLGDLLKFEVINISNNKKKVYKIRKDVVLELFRVKNKL